MNYFIPVPLTPVLAAAAKALGVDLAALRTPARVPRTAVQKRDLLIYLLRQAGGRTNQEIGDIFGLTYSAVSRRAALFKQKLAAGNTAARDYERVKAKITRRL